MSSSTFEKEIERLSECDFNSNQRHSSQYALHLEMTLIVPKFDDLTRDERTKNSSQAFLMRGEACQEIDEVILVECQLVSQLFVEAVKAGAVRSKQIS